MKNHDVYLTAGQFAKIHNINKRTLHYYDEIGLFSPKIIGDNNYRYYTYEQSMELEHILSLREIGMSIEEIRKYVQSPNHKSFLDLTDQKINEIDNTINHLEKLKNILNQKKDMIVLSDSIYDGKIEMIDLDEEYLLMTPINLNFEKNDIINDNRYNINKIIDHLTEASKLCTYKSNCGSYITVEKIKYQNFYEYDGIFTIINDRHSNLITRSKGKYVRAFNIGDWDKIPNLYQNIIKFIEMNNLEIVGYAFETGLNEFAISNIDEYVTQILIKCIER